MFRPVRDMEVQALCEQLQVVESTGGENCMLEILVSCGVRMEEICVRGPQSLGNMDGFMVIARVKVTVTVEC